MHRLFFILLILCLAVQPARASGFRFASASESGGASGSASLSAFAIETNACRMLFGNSVHRSIAAPSNGLAKLTLETIESSIREITTADDLTHLFVKILVLQTHAEIQDVEELSHDIFAQLGVSGAHDVAKRMILNHRHGTYAAASRLIFEYLDRIGAPQIAKMTENLPMALPSRLFVHWVELGEGFRENTKFITAVKLAVLDSLNFVAGLGATIDPKTASEDFLFALEGLNDPSLIGRFVDLFERSDRITRASIIDHSWILSRQADGRFSLDLAGSFDSKPDGVAIAMTNLVARPLQQLQEDAYVRLLVFGNAHLHSSEPNQIKRILLNYLARQNYDLARFDVDRVADLLAGLPIVSRDIDEAMSRLIQSEKQIPSLSNYYDFIYARHELRMLTRYANGFAETSPPLTHIETLLSKPPETTAALNPLLAFHAKYDVRRFPHLHKLVANFLTTYPGPFGPTSEKKAAELERLKRDLGL